MRLINNELDRSSHHDGRLNAKLTLIYNIINSHVDIPSDKNAKPVIVFHFGKSILIIFR